MRRFRLYWGEHNIRTKGTIEELLDWAERCLHDCHANLFDGDEYICTLCVEDYGSVTYAINGTIVTKDDTVLMCTDIIIEED